MGSGEFRGVEKETRYARVMGMGEVVSETQKAGQVDKRVVLAIIKALMRVGKLVVPREVVEEELRQMVKNDDEFWELLYELDFSESMRKHVYPFYDWLVTSPRKLSDEQLATLNELGRLYNFEKTFDYEPFEGYKDAIINVVHTLIKMWNDPCFGLVSAAEAAYDLAVFNGLDTKKVEDTLHKDPDGIGHITYSIEDSILVSMSLSPCICGEERGDCTKWEFVEPSKVQNNTQG